MTGTQLISKPLVHVLGQPSALKKCPPNNLPDWNSGQQKIIRGNHVAVAQKKVPKWHLVEMEPRAQTCVTLGLLL